MLIKFWMKNFMELKEVIKELRKYLWLFVVFPALGLIGAFVYNLNWIPTFETEKIIYVAPIVDKNSSFSWPIGAQDFTDNLISILANRNDQSSYQIQKLGPSFLKITNTAKSKAESQKLNNVEISEIESQINNLNSQTGLNFKIIDFGQSTGPKYSMNFLKINLFVGLLTGVVFGSIVFSFLLYFRKLKK